MIDSKTNGNKLRTREGKTLTLQRYCIIKAAHLKWQYAIFITVGIRSREKWVRDGGAVSSGVQRHITRPLCLLMLSFFYMVVHVNLLLLPKLQETRANSMTRAPNK